VLEFETYQQRMVKATVGALCHLFKGDPVGAIPIGEALGMKNFQTLKYLKLASQAGLIRAIHAKDSNWIRGWVPAKSSFPRSWDEFRARVVAGALQKAYTGRPLSCAEIAKFMGVPASNVVRWIRDAERFGFAAYSRSPQGWTPLI
jgi:hypothetical protein